MFVALGDFDRRLTPVDDRCEAAQPRRDDAAWSCVARSLVTEQDNKTTGKLKPTCRRPLSSARRLSVGVEDGLFSLTVEKGAI